MAAISCWCCSLFTGCMWVVFYQLCSTAVGVAIGSFVLAVGGCGFYGTAVLYLTFSLLSLPPAICLLCGFLKVTNHEALVEIWRVVVRIRIILVVAWSVVVLMVYASGHEMYIPQTGLLSPGMCLDILCINTVNRYYVMMRKTKTDVNGLDVVCYTRTKVDLLETVDPSASEIVTVTVNEDTDLLSSYSTHITKCSRT